MTANAGMRAAQCSLAESSLLKPAFSPRARRIARQRTLASTSQNAPGSGFYAVVFSGPAGYPRNAREQGREEP
jgi:hypothetical protein